MESTNTTYAVFRDRTKQHRAVPGETLVLDPIAGKKTGDTVEFGDVLLVRQDASIKIGTPSIAGAKVRGTITKEFRGEKIDVVRFIRREDSCRKLGHRQPYVNVKIEKIEA